MKKEIVYKTMISSTVFLCFVFVIFSWIKADDSKKVENHEQTTTAVLANEPTLPENEKGKKIMYLTFDDGPSKNTAKILDILDKYKVKATFFVTGANPDFYSMIKEEKNRGHAIGIHTFSHEYSQIYKSEEAYFKDFYKLNALIEEEIGEKTSFLRFPGGASNTVSRKYKNGIMTTLASSVLNKGFQYYDWNASNGDGDCYLSASSLISQANKEIKGKDVVMMLMHDGGSNNATVEALPAILESMIQQGYEFRVINGSTPVFHHSIAN